MPDSERHIEKERHESENKRHPLIVINTMLSNLGRIRQVIIGGHIIGISNPTDIVGVSDHSAGELRRRPACYGRADELRRAH